MSASRWPSKVPNFAAQVSLEQKARLNTDGVFTMPAAAKGPVDTFCPSVPARAKIVARRAGRLAVSGDRRLGEERAPQRHLRRARVDHERQGLHRILGRREALVDVHGHRREEPGLLLACEQPRPRARSSLPARVRVVWRAPSFHRESLPFDLYPVRLEHGCAIACATRARGSPVAQRRARRAHAACRKRAAVMARAVLRGCA